MKKYLLATIIFLIGTNFAISGPLKLVNQNDTVLGTIEMDELIAYAQIQNTTSEPVSFNIRMSFLEITSGHAAALCWETCFEASDMTFTSPDTYTLDADSISAFAKFTGHLYPYKLLSLDPLKYSDPAPGTTIVRYSYMPVGSTPDDYLYYDVVFVVTDPTNVVEEEVNFNINTAYPNPANDLLYLDLGNGFENPASINIYDINGNSLVKQQINSGSTKEVVSVSALPVGSYYLNIRMGNKLRTKKFNVVR